MNGASLSPWRLLCYAAPGIPVAMVLYAVGVVVPGFYVSAVGLSATAVGTVMMLTRLADVGFDFAIGYLSDQTKSRFGRRKLWVLAGGVLTGAASWILLSPPDGASAEYFFWSLLGFYFGWSMMTVPYDAWGSELAGDYAARSRLFTYRVAAGYFGSLLFSALPIIPIFATSDFSPEVMQFAAVLAAVLLVLTLPLALRYVPAEPPAPPKKADLAGLVRALRLNRPLQIYAASAVLTGLSNGMFVAVVYIYQTDYMLYGEQFWLMLIVYIAASFVALPVWAPLVRLLGKHRAWAIALGLNSACYPPMAFLEPGAASFMPMLILVALSGATYSVVNVVMPAVLGDVVDYETLKSGVGRAGNIFALQALIAKFNVAVGGGLAFVIIGWFGFQAGAQTQTPAGIFGIQLTFLYLPALLNMLALPFVWKFPLTARAQAIIRRKLDKIAVQTA